MNQTVIGVYDTKNQATEAKQALIASGFSSSNVDFSTYGENGTVGTNFRDNENSVRGFFSNLFGNDDDTVTRYTDVASRGTVVTVYTDTMAEAKKAAAILDQYGSIDLDDRYTAYSNDSFNCDTNLAHLNETYGNGKIEVIKEDIAVGKREVTTGGVTVTSRIIEKPIQETLRLREEHIVIERTPVDRPATAADFQTETISLTETAEEAVVQKDARVVEEIAVGKDVSERTETITETIRETEVDIEKVKGEVVRTHNETVA